MAKKAPSQILETHGVTTLVHEMKDLPIPNEMMSEILSYLENKEKLNVSLVNKRWFQIINSQIEVLESIRRPDDLEELEELQNLLNRFPKLRSLSLANRIDDLSELIPLKSLAFKDFSLEFDLDRDLIQTINPEWTHDAPLYSTWTSIKRVKLENFEDFENFEYKPNTIIHLEAEVRRSNFEAVREEILSLNFVRRISIIAIKNYRLIEAILTRPNLNQIDFFLDSFDLDSNIQQGFQKNVTVEEITLRSSGIRALEFWKQLFDALPNTKRVRIVFRRHVDVLEMENMLEFLKIISDFKNLEFLHFAIEDLKDSGVRKMQDCCNIIDNFPIKAKVIIADIDKDGDLENVVEKEEGKPPKIVYSRYPLRKLFLA